MIFFLKWPPSRWVDRAEILHSLLGILCATFQKKWSGQVRSYDVIRGTDSDRFFEKSVFSANVTCHHWLAWRHYAWFGSTHDHIWPLTLHFDHSRVIQGHWPWLTRCLPILANLAVLGVSWGPQTKYVTKFSHRHVYSAFLHKPMSISPIDQVCLRVILRISVTLFPSEMLSVTNIPSINCNNT